MAGSEFSDTKGDSSVGSQVHVAVIGDWDEGEERRLVRKIDMRCMVS